MNQRCLLLHIHRIDKVASKKCKKDRLHYHRIHKGLQSQKKQINELAVKYNVSNEQVIKLLVSDAISDDYIEKLEWSEPKHFCNAT